MTKKPFRGVAATTHRDRHGERIKPEVLRQFVDKFAAADGLHWSYWDHMETLPPIAAVEHSSLEEAADGELLWVVEGRELDDADFETFAGTDQLEVNPGGTSEVPSFLPVHDIALGYDPRNLPPSDIAFAMEPLRSLVRVREQQRIRKAELPTPIL